MGLTAGGAQDVGDFRNNVEEGYLPLPESLSYEGLFSEYYFDTGGGGDCESMFCASSSPGSSPEITVSYETRDGRERTDRAAVTFPDGSEEHYDNSGVRKSILLSRYANLLRNWMIHERDEELVEGQGDVDVPPEEGLGRWEQQSEELRVTPPYVDRIDTFRDRYEFVAADLGDEALAQEVEMMDTILEAAEPDESTAAAIDDAIGTDGPEAGAAQSNRRSLFGWS